MVRTLARLRSLASPTLLPMRRVLCAVPTLVAGTRPITVTVSLVCMLQEIFLSMCPPSTLPFFGVYSRVCSEFCCSPVFAHACAQNSAVLTAPCYFLDPTPAVGGFYGGSSAPLMMKEVYENGPVAVAFEVGCSSVAECFFLCCVYPFSPLITGGLLCCRVLNLCP